MGLSSRTFIWPRKIQPLTFQAMMKGTIEGGTTNAARFASRGTSVSHVSSRANVGSSLQRPRGVSESLSTHDSSSGAYYSGASTNEDDDDDENDYGDENDEAFEDQQSCYGNKTRSSGPLSILETENNQGHRNKKNDDNRYWFSDMVHKSIFGDEIIPHRRQNHQNAATLEYYSTKELRQSSQSTVASKPRRKSTILRQLEVEEKEELDSKRRQAREISHKIRAIQSQLTQNKKGSPTNHASVGTKSSSPSRLQHEASNEEEQEETWDYNLKDHRTTSWNYFYPSGIADLTTPRPLAERRKRPSLSNNKDTTTTKQSPTAQRPSMATPQPLQQHSPAKHSGISDALSYSSEDSESDGEDSLVAASTYPRQKAVKGNDAQVVVRVPLSSKKDPSSTPATVLSHQSLSQDSQDLILQSKDAIRRTTPASHDNRRGNFLSSAWKAAKTATNRNTNTQMDEKDFDQGNSMKLESRVSNSPQHASYKSPDDMDKESFQSAVSEIRRQLSRDTFASGQVNESRSMYSGSTLTSRDTVDCAMSFSSRRRGGSSMNVDESSFTKVSPNQSLSHQRLSPNNSNKLSFRRGIKASTSLDHNKKSTRGYYENVYSTRSWPIKQQTTTTLRQMQQANTAENKSPSAIRNEFELAKPTEEKDGQNPLPIKNPEKMNGATRINVSSLYGRTTEVLSSHESGDLSLDAKPKKFTMSKIKSPKRPCLKSPEKSNINKDSMLGNGRYSKPTPRDGSGPLHPLIRIISAGKNTKSAMNQWKSPEKVPSPQNEEDEIVFDPQNAQSENGPIKSPIYKDLEETKGKHSLWNNPGLWDTMQEDDLDEDVALGYPPNLGKYMADYEDQNNTAKASTFGSSFFCSRSNRDVTEEIRARSSPVEAAHSQKEHTRDAITPPVASSSEDATKSKTILGKLTCSGQASLNTVKPKEIENSDSTRPAQQPKCDPSQPEENNEKADCEKPSNYEPDDLVDDSLDSDMGPFKAETKSDVSVQKFTFSGYTNSTVGSSIDGHLSIKNDEVEHFAKAQSGDSPSLGPNSPQPLRSKSSHDKPLQESSHSHGSKSTSSAPMFHCGNRNIFADSNEEIIPVGQGRVDMGAFNSEEDVNQPDDNAALDVDAPQSSWTPKIQQLIAQATGIKAEIKKELKRDSLSSSSSNETLSSQSISKVNNSSSNLDAPDSCHSKKVVFVSAPEVQSSHSNHNPPAKESARKPIKSILSNRSESSFEGEQNSEDPIAKFKTQRDNLHISTSIYSNDSSTVYGPSPRKAQSSLMSTFSVSASKSTNDSSTEECLLSPWKSRISASRSGSRIAASKSADSSSVFGPSPLKTKLSEPTTSEPKTRDLTRVQDHDLVTATSDKVDSVVVVQHQSKNKHLAKRLGIFGRRKASTKDGSQTLAKNDRAEDAEIAEKTRPKDLVEHETDDPPQPKRLQGRARKLLNRFTSKKKTGNSQQEYDMNQKGKNSMEIEFNSTASDQSTDAVGPIDSESIFHNIEASKTPSKEVPFDRKSARVGMAECNPILDEYSQNGDFDENQLSPQSRELYLAEEQLSKRLAKDLELLTKIHKLKQDRKGTAKSSSVARAATTIKDIQRLILRQHETLKHDTRTNEDKHDRMINTETYDEDDVATEIFEEGFLDDDEDEVSNASYVANSRSEEAKNQSWGTHYDICGSSNQVQDEDAI